ncbi:MAG: hypothetical protein WBA74_07700 [Cyclobacteriaceae bacterium]
MRNFGLLVVLVLLYSCDGKSNKDYSVMDSTLVRDNTSVAEDNLPILDSLANDSIATDTLKAVKIKDSALKPPIVDTLKPVKVVEEPVGEQSKKKER